MNILVVHNGNDFLLLLIDVLRISGYMAMKAENLKEAREILEMEKLALVITEQASGREDGVRFHSFIREFSENPDTPFVFISDKEGEDFGIERSLSDHFMNSSDGAIAIVNVLEEIGLNPDALPREVAGA